MRPIQLVFFLCLTWCGAGLVEIPLLLASSVFRLRWSIRAAMGIAMARETEQFKAITEEGDTVVVLNFGTRRSEIGLITAGDERVRPSSYRLTDGRRVTPVDNDETIFRVAGTGRIIRRIVIPDAR